MGLSAEQKADIWRRGKLGESVQEIGRAYDKDHGSIQFMLSRYGGFAPSYELRAGLYYQKELLFYGLGAQIAIRIPIDVA